MTKDRGFSSGSVMQVHLISFTPDPELLAAAAARLCFRDISATEIMRDLTPLDVDKLLNIVIPSGHHSVIEHITFTFAIDGISRVLSHQLVRHRVGIAFSQQSQRYASASEAGCITPRSVRAQADMREKYEGAVAECFELYRELCRNGVPEEDARYVLPQGVTTRVLMTANLRQLKHMYSINACFRSQWELRQLMQKVKRELHTASPRLSRELRIKCFELGYCDEKHMCEELAGRMPNKSEFLELGSPKTAQDYRDMAAEVGEL